MPPIGLALGGVDFSALFINLSGVDYANLAEAKEAGAPTINYGIFGNAILDFVIVAFVLFVIIRQMNRLKRKEEAPAAEPTTKDCQFCASEIAIKATKCPQCTSAL